MSNTIQWLRAAFTAVPLIVLCVLASACAPDDDPVDFEHLNGLLVADPGVYVVPDRAWKNEEEAGWSIAKAGKLVVHIEGVQPTGMSVDFQTEGNNRRLHFYPTWDGEPLWDLPRHSVDGVLRIEVPAKRLSQGAHVLKLIRVHAKDAPADRSTLRSYFSGAKVVLNLDDRIEIHSVTQNPPLARFLEFGMTSREATRLSGALFIGSNEHAFDVNPGPEAVAVFDLMNLSRKPGEFRVVVDGSVVGEDQLAPGGRRRVRYPIPEGARSIVLSTQGAPGSGLLWGAPYLEAVRKRCQPPVVLISLDTTRRDVIAPFSGEEKLTPILHEFAGGSTVFPNAYAVAPWTLPSHASMFTGLYPSHHRVGVRDDGRVEDNLTVAKALRIAGYRTAGFAGGYMASSAFGLGYGFSQFRDPRKTQEPANVITDAAVGYIRANAEQPLFLFLNYFDPHAPYRAPAEFRRAVGVDDHAKKLADMPVWGSFARNEAGAWPVIIEGRAPESADGLAYLRAAYSAEVAFMDSEIGRLFDALKAESLFDEAMIVVVADHGEYLGERGLFAHSFRLDRELTAIPLLIKWPGQRTGRVVEDLVSHVDLFPAIAAAVGLPLPATDGLDFDLNDWGRLGTREYVYMEEHKSLYHQIKGRFWLADHLFGRQGLRSKEIVYQGFVGCERLTEKGWVAEECERTWESALASLPDAMRMDAGATDVESGNALSEDEAEKLRALGYLHE